MKPNWHIGDTWDDAQRVYVGMQLGFDHNAPRTYRIETITARAWQHGRLGMSVANANVVSFSAELFSWWRRGRRMYHVVGWSGNDTHVFIHVRLAMVSGSIDGLDLPI
jgi:hypothetical protein